MAASLIALEELLKAAFTSAELHRVICHLDEPAGLADSLPSPQAVSENAYVFELVMALLRHNALGDAFFEAVAGVRPGWAKQLAQVRRRLEGDGESQLDSRLDVLILKAEPNTQPPGWDWEREARLVVKAVEAASGEVDVGLHIWPHTTDGDLPERLQRHRPHLLHVIGHCTSAGIILHDGRGGLVDFPDASFCSVLGRHRDHLRLVVLNACDSVGLAQALTAHVRHVVGWDGTVLDSVAVTFAGAFYQSFFTGASVADSFGNARDVAAGHPHVTHRIVPTRGASQQPPEVALPVLFSAPEADPAAEHLGNLW